MNSFIQEGNLKNISINETILWHVVLDCYTDIYRMKSFHNVKEVNDEEQSIFINEKFVLSQILSFISKNNEDNLTIIANEKMDYFTATLFYFLKYRIKNPQTIELMLLAFEAGKEYQKMS
jgi:hypothetical protein